jgi:hypothetical protein
MVFAERGETISGGNFHGEYPAKVCNGFTILQVIHIRSKYGIYGLRRKFCNQCTK